MKRSNLSDKTEGDRDVTEVRGRAGRRRRVGRAPSAWGLAGSHERRALRGSHWQGWSAGLLAVGTRGQAPSVGTVVLPCATLESGPMAPEAAGSQGVGLWSQASGVQTLVLSLVDPSVPHGSRW